MILIALYNLLSLFSCWLPSEKGMIFAFVGPMIVILLVRYCTIKSYLQFICKFDLNITLVLSICDFLYCMYR